jgi:hypothetical protein
MVVDTWGGIGKRFTRDAWEKVQMSVMETGCGLVVVRDMRELARRVGLMIEWSGEVHKLGMTRPKAVETGSWGEKTNAHWGSWFLQGLPGVGADRAGAIIRHFGRVPVKLDVDAGELMKVPGLGKKTVEAIVKGIG